MMKNIPFTWVAVAMVASLLLFPGAVRSLSAGDAIASDVYLGLPDGLFTPQDDKDLNACQQDCRSRFGYDLYATPQWRGGGGRDGAYYAYANCVAECNQRFWKAFDKEMDNLEREN